ESRVVTSLELDEVGARRGDVTQDVHDLALDVINLNHRRVPFLANNTGATDRLRKEVRPIGRISIQCPDAIGRCIHVLTDDSLNAVGLHEPATRSGETDPQEERLRKPYPAFRSPLSWRSHLPSLPLDADRHPHGPFGPGQRP